MQGVDTLPAELPKEATDHFGEHLMPLLPNLIDSDGTLPLEQQRHELNPSWFGSMITAHGKLTPEYEYIQDLRENNERIAALHASASHTAEETEKAKAAAARILLRGHLFDNAIINKSLDIVENVEGCGVNMVDWSLGTTKDESSSAVLEIYSDEADAETIVNLAVERIEGLTKAMTHIAPIAFRNITGLQMDTGSSEDNAHDSGVRTVAKSPVPNCEGKSALILGSGMVVGPALQVIADSGVSVTLASNELEAAQELVAPFQQPAANAQSVDAVFLDMNDAEGLPSLVADHDVVISLLPATMHVQVAELCIENGKHFVSASYESPQMRELDERARSAGLTLLNEIGLDPGIDHMSAMKIIDEAHERGEKVTSFTSLCGGLPAPEAADNPLGYKFSWNPAGVLQASQNPAQFLHRKKLQQVPGDQLMLQCRPVDIGSSALSLEQLPNRDSMIYQELYGLPDAHTVYRGTLRYSGFAPIVHALSKIGLFDNEKSIGDWLEGSDAKTLANPTWADLMTAVVQPIEGMGIRRTLRERLELEFFGSDSRNIAFKSVEAFDFLGLFGSDKKSDSLLDALAAGKTARGVLCDRLEERLSYNDGESDMVLLHHEFHMESPEGKKRRVTSTLQATGEPYPAGPSAMATTVGLPVGIAALMVLNGTIEQRGAILPLTKDIYDPILDTLEELGVVCTEKEEAVR